ncbi:Nramp family divalent metal transporter [Streptomyces sp. HNM0575]|uniref:Nramp family divalent metal transporter n=1 Tax=Streptomyces sp. HNM0575 TaxID=2716338 RepID=UPI00145DFAE8|nr:Nramp family divalent metal transporter [Streptomyces sp. HNM0575]NLU74372.1 Nramp family divalent metal transporter [Streptomyces sp. HNM0575]
MSVFRSGASRAGAGNSGGPVDHRASATVDDRGVPVPPGAGIAEGSAPVPVKSFWKYLRSFGPGIVVALSWVGTGDLIDNSVAGGNYGYALLWVLPLTLVFRFVFVNSLGKYPLFNVQRDPSIVRGLARTHWLFGWLMLVSFVIYTHILMAFTLSGVGVALHGLFGGLPAFWWTLIGAASVFVVTFKGVYRLIERLFKAILAVMVASFVIGIVMVGIDWGALLQGFAFELPEKQGLFDSGLIASSLVLATLGSMANLFYPQFLREKGWTTPAHRRVQQYDLLFGTFVVLFLAAAIWAIGAEVLHRDSGVGDADAIARALGTAIGPVGPYVFYLGLLGAAWTTVSGSIFALGKMTVEALHVVLPERAVRRGGEPGKDPFYKVMVAWGLLAVVWSLPGMPGFIVLVVVSHVLTSPFLLVIAIGMIGMLNSEAIMGTHTNNWRENTGLVIITLFVAAAAWQGLSDAVKMIA